tara:strand:+ start:1457 stop:2272 length:816 start_codon:yes stop_codon:yes gene_type:complete
LSAHIPIKLKKKNLGWVNKCNVKLFESSDLKKGFISFKELKKFLRNKNRLSQILSEFNIKKYEYCPIFEYESLNPKTKFNHKLRFGNQKLVDIERRFLPIFGLPAYGVHCNAWSKFKNSTIIHFAIRSKRIRKFPGFSDNLVAGGQPSKISIKKNLEKEAYEEAGLKPNIVKLAQQGNVIHYYHNEKKNFSSAIIFVYDLKLDKNTKFKNIDGEVSDFFSLDIQNIFTILDSNALKPNCVIPLADFFLRIAGDYFPKSGILEIKKILKVDE